HLAEDAVHVERLRADIGFARDLSTDGDQEVASVHLHPVSGVVEQADTTFAHLLAELRDGTTHGRYVRVHAIDDLETLRAECLRNASRVVAGIVQRGVCVRCVSDDERYAMLACGGAFRLRPCACDGYADQQYHQQPLRHAYTSYDCI